MDAMNNWAMSWITSGATEGFGWLARAWIYQRIRMIGNYRMTRRFWMAGILPGLVGDSSEV